MHTVKHHKQIITGAIYMTSKPYQTNVLMHILPNLLPTLGPIAALDMAMQITDRMTPEEQLSYVQNHLPELLI